MNRGGIAEPAIPRPARDSIPVAGGIVFLWLCLAAARPGSLAGQETGQDPGTGARATLLGDWVELSVGTDETSQSVRVKVWGALRDSSFFRHGFMQLDDDPPLEYAIISRNEGTGPYYKLQIVDLRPDGILVWSYDSYERPTLARSEVTLGQPPVGDAAPVRRRYRLTPLGLEAITR